jgi:hypothetical protein
MPPPEPSPRKKNRAGLLVAAVVVIIAAIIFIGYNLSHMQASQNEQQGDRPAAEQPQTSDDLTREPIGNRI